MPVSSCVRRSLSLLGFFAADPHYVKKHPVRAKAKLTYLARPGSRMALLDGHEQGPVPGAMDAQ